MASQGLGYASGLLEGTVRLRELALREDQQQINREQLGLQQQTTQESILKSKLERTNLERSLKRQQDLDNILTDSFRDNPNMDLAKRLQQVGSSALAVDPKAGTDMLKQASEMRRQNHLERVDALKIKEAQMNIQAEVANNVTDQGSLDEAIVELAGVGVNVPEKYRVYNDETKAWLGRRAVASDSFRKALAVEQKAIEIDLRKQDVESKIQYRQDRLNQLERSEESKRMAGRSKETIRPLSQRDVQTTMLDLGQDKIFTKLPKEDQIAASNDYYSVATSLYRNGEAETLELAKAQARQEILSRIDDKTKRYSGFRAEAEQRSSVPSETEWLIAAKKANPNATEEQLRNYYKTNYGNR